MTIPRIGQGFDMHALVAGVPLTLGGVAIPHTHGLSGHSDGDALLHAISDAMLGATGLGDMGDHFPSNTQTPKGIDSRVILRTVHNLLKQKGYQLLQIDSTIIAQSPKLSPYISDMRHTIASELSLPIDAISVKAKSTDHLGAIGRGEGIAAMAVVLVCS